MYKNCKTPHSEARQLEFQNVLLKMMETQQFCDISITSLCKEMGITRKPFYKYFDSLEDVLYAILDRELIHSFLFWQYKLEIEKFFVYWQERKWLLDLLEKNNLIDMVTSRSFLVALLGGHIQEYSVSSLKYTGWISAVTAVLIAWNRGGMVQTPKEMEQIICDMFKIDLDEIKKNYK